MGLLENLEAMIARGQDGPLVRYGLGNEHLKLAQYDSAVMHLRKAVEQNPGYSAAWKLLGQALGGAGRKAEAIDAYEKGIAAAEQKGDQQAVKEMRVFLKRLQKPQ